VLGILLFGEWGWGGGVRGRLNRGEKEQDWKKNSVKAKLTNQKEAWENYVFSSATGNYDS